LICKWADDSQHLILENFNVIQDSPAKLYNEAVPFSPSSSWLHEWHSPEVLQGVKVVKGLRAGWETCFRTVLFDETLLAFACWNNLIVVGLWSGDIITLDATTGICTSALSGHTGPARSLAFSSDGTSLVSGSFDRTVKLWDIQTGGVIRTFHGHTGNVMSVSISPDCSIIASGSGDGTVHLWKAQTGECCCVIQHNHMVYSAQFSPTNSQLLISASQDSTVQQWNINGDKIGPTYEGRFATFSSHGPHFVSWCRGYAIVWNSDSGVAVAKLQPPNNAFEACCLSPDNKSVAGACNDLIYIWDITGLDPHLIKTLVGDHSITSIAFSSPLILISCGNSIKFWQIDILSTDLVAASPESKPSPSALIMSISVQAKDQIAISSDGAGVVRIWDISTGLCKSSIKILAGPHSRRDMQLIDGRLLIVWCTHKKIYIWDTKKEKHPKKVDAISDFSTTSLRISGDGSTVFLLDSKQIQALSTQTGEVMGKVRFQGEPSKNPLSIDGLRVWVHFKSLLTQGWDFGISGSIPVTISNELLPSPHLRFIHSTTKGTITYPSRIKYTLTGKDILQLPREYEKPTKIHCDGQYLIAAYKTGELLILDFSQMISL